METPRFKQSWKHILEEAESIFVRLATRQVGVCPLHILCLFFGWIFLRILSIPWDENHYDKTTHLVGICFWFFPTICLSPSFAHTTHVQRNEAESLLLCEGWLPNGILPALKLSFPNHFSGASSHLAFSFRECKESTGTPKGRSGNAPYDSCWQGGSQNKWISSFEGESFLAGKFLLDLMNQNLGPKKTMWKNSWQIFCDRNIFRKSLVKTDIVTENTAMSLLALHPGLPGSDFGGAKLVAIIKMWNSNVVSTHLWNTPQATFTNRL